MKKPTVSQALEKKIQQEYFVPEAVFLPSATEIAGKFGVSRNNVLKALQNLAAQNLLEVHPGRKTRISGKAGSLSAAAIALKSHIENGRFSTDTRLPKLANLSNELGWSSRVVQAGLIKLEQTGHVHKQGRAWYVGRKSPNPKKYSVTKPTILVILNNPYTWISLRNDRTDRFVRTFQDQINHLGIEMKPVYPPYRAFTADELRFDTSEFDQYVKHLGSRLIGILLPLKNRAHLPLPDVLKKLSPRTPCLFWADFHDEKLNLRQDKPPNVITGKFSESRALELAKELLHSNGHQTIVYPYEESIEWQKIRMHKLKGIMDGDMQLIPVSLNPKKLFDKFHLIAEILKESKHLLPSPASEILTEFFSSKTPFAPGKMAPGSVNNLDDLLSASLPDYRQIKAGGILRSLAFTPVFAPLFNNPEITAVCLPNEGFARSFYKWCIMIGLSIPKDLSILSFDNYFQHSLVPISSIDFGLDSLAYSAVHLMFGDIPVQTGKNKCVYSRPFLSERGSLGPVRKKKLENRFLKYITRSRYYMD